MSLARERRCDPAAGLGAGDLGKSCLAACVALATDAASFTLAHAAPDAELLAIRKCVLKAVVLHDAVAADLFGFARGSTSLREEQIGVNAQAI